jgi:hypothetical protein
MRRHDGFGCFECFLPIPVRRDLFNDRTIVSETFTESLGAVQNLVAAFLTQDDCNRTIGN